MTTPGSPVLLAARELLRDAVAMYEGTPERDVLGDALADLDGPLTVAFAGRVKAGKSTLLNALVGQRIAATDATECTRIVTSYVNGPAVRARAHLRSGEHVQVALARQGRGARIDLGAVSADDVARLEVETPSARLERVTFIDTPGIGSARGEVSARTEEFLVGTGTGADAVLYLMGHLHVADVGFLKAFHDEQFTGTAPVNAVGVLSRADELAGGREDSLAVAARIAADYRADQRVRALVQTVVPVSGLLAVGATEISEGHVATLRALAAGSSALLLSADRLVAERPEVGIPAAPRAELLDLLGMFGVRLAVALLRHGAASDAVELAAALRSVSGLDALRALLLDRFTARASALKAQNALRLIESVTARSPVTGLDVLRRRAEGVVAGAHELAEMRLLNDLRTGHVRLGDEALVAEVERLLGSHGDVVDARLGLDPGADEREVRSAAVATLRRWQRRGESPVATPDERRVAQVVRRTCEGMLAGLRLSAR